jgi:hypothetical protein
LTHRILISAESATHLLFPTNPRQFIVFLRELLQIFFPGAPIAPSGCHDIERVAEIAVPIGRAIVHILHNNLTPTLLSCSADQRLHHRVESLFATAIVQLPDSFLLNSFLRISQPVFLWQSRSVSGELVQSPPIRTQPGSDRDLFRLQLRTLRFPSFIRKVASPIKVSLLFVLQLWKI